MGWFMFFGFGDEDVSGQINERARRLIAVMVFFSVVVELYDWTSKQNF